MMLVVLAVLEGLCAYLEVCMEGIYSSSCGPLHLCKCNHARGSYETAYVTNVTYVTKVMGMPKRLLAGRVASLCISGVLHPVGVGA